MEGHLSHQNQKHSSMLSISGVRHFKHLHSYGGTFIPLKKKKTIINVINHALNQSINQSSKPKTMINVINVINKWSVSF